MGRTNLMVLLFALVASATGCSGGDPKMVMKVRSAAFEDGAPIPAMYTQDGIDVSPPIAWEGVPQGTRQFALIMDDPDAPIAEPFVHWVIYGIPGDVRELPENVPPKATLSSPPGAMQGRTSWTKGYSIGYRGPAPPRGHGLHHYHFRLYALDSELKLEPELDKAALLKAIQGHVLGVGLLVGTYHR